MQLGAGASNMLYTLAQITEESAQYVSAAAVFCANPSEHKQMAVIASNAEHAMQRTSWACGMVLACEPSESPELDPNWVDSLKKTVRQLKDSAQNMLIECRTADKAHRDSQPLPPEELDRVRRSRVPCKFFEQGHCPRGEKCGFSHDPRDSQPKPLDHKRAEECSFFRKGMCTRGAGCAFAHGQEELLVIESLRAEKERQLVRKEREALQPLARPGDWRCWKCDSLVYASKLSCFKCKTPKADDNGLEAQLAERERKNRAMDFAGRKDFHGQEVRPGDWRCKKCDALVYASKNDCFRCRTPRGAEDM